MQFMQCDGEALCRSLPEILTLLGAGSLHPYGCRYVLHFLWAQTSCPESLCRKIDCKHNFTIENRKKKNMKPLQKWTDAPRPRKLVQQHGDRGNDGAKSCMRTGTLEAMCAVCRRLTCDGIQTEGKEHRRWCRRCQCECQWRCCQGRPLHPGTGTGSSPLKTHTAPSQSNPCLKEGFFPKPHFHYLESRLCALLTARNDNDTAHTSRLVDLRLRVCLASRMTSFPEYEYELSTFTAHLISWGFYIFFTMSIKNSTYKKSNR